MSMTAFLLARFAEDEAAARAATGDRWRVTAEGSEGSRIAPDCEDKRERSRFIGIANGRVQPEDGCNAEHIARHDPARVLSDVEAKRRLLDALEAQRMAAPRIMSNWLDSLLRILAAVYSDHPDYRQEWKP